MTDKEALLVALEALHYCEALNRDVDERKMQAITAIKEALAEHAMSEVQRLGQEIEQEPVAWLLMDKNINALQVESIQRLIDRLKHALHTDLCVRINGKDEWFEADWLKHMVRVTPPQRKPLTKEQIEPMAIDVLGYGALLKEDMELFTEAVRAVEAAHGIKGGA